ncbi:unnamed protein product, partial [Meganyctiphanes norvegica]
SGNRVKGFGKNRFHQNDKDNFWPGKNQAAIELEEEPDDWEASKTGSDEYDYMDAAPVRHVNSGDRMRPHEIALMKLASDNARRVMDEGNVPNLFENVCQLPVILKRSTGQHVRWCTVVMIQPDAVLPNNTPASQRTATILTSTSMSL